MLKLLSTGADEKTGGFASQQLVLSTNQPAGIKQMPTNLIAPLFSEITFGPREASNKFFVIVDEPTNQLALLFVDANGKGDFSDNQAVIWTAEENVNTQNCNHYTNYESAAALKATFGSNVVDLGISLYRFDKTNPRRAAFKDVLFYSVFR